MFPRNLKGVRPMSPIVYRMHGILSRVVQGVPVGTKLGLLPLLWMLLSGRLLRSRGVRVDVVQDVRCIRMMEEFIAERPELWNEDIGAISKG